MHDEVQKNWIAAVSASTGSIAIASMLACISGAQVGLEFKLGSFPRLLRRRNLVSVISRNLRAGFFAACSIQVVSLCFYIPFAIGGSGFPELGILVYQLAVLVFSTLLGFVLGSLLPAAVAIPLSAFASYQLLVVPPSLDSNAYMIMSGWGQWACCSLDHSFNYLNLLLSLIAHAVFALLFALLALVRWSRIAAWLKGLVFSIGSIATWAALLLFLNVSHSLPQWPEIIRTRSDLVCEGNAPKVCLYPNQDFDKTARPQIRQIWMMLHEYDQEIPSTIVGRSTPEYVPSEMQLTLHAYNSQDSILANMINAAVPMTVECVNDDAYWNAHDLALNFLARDFSYKNIDLSSRFQMYSPENEKTYEQLTALERAKQLEWFSKTVKSLKSCQPFEEVDF